MSLKIKEISFRKKLVLLVSAAILLPLASASLVFGVLMNRQFDSIYANRLKAGLQVLSLMIQDRNNELMLSLSKATTDNTLQMTMVLEIIPQLRNYLSSQGKALGLSSLGVANVGQEVLAMEGVPLSFKLDRQDTQLLAHDKAVYFCQAAPIRRGDELLGYVAGAIELTSDDFIHRLQEAMTENFIVWVEGRPVLTDLDVKPEEIYTYNLPNHNVVDIDLAGNRYRMLSNTSFYGSLPITISVVIPKTELTRSFANMTLIISLIVLVLFSIIMSLLHRVVRGLAVPVQALTGAAGALEKGDYQVPELDYNRLDEFGTLNRTFRNMAVALQHHIGNMEKVVKDRTAELSAANTALMNDIIKRERTEKEKAQLEEQLLQARKLESIGILAGGIAHDFNNMLTGILNNISLAKLHLDINSKAFKVLENTETATLRASDLTKQLLTFSKGGAPIKRRASVGDLVRETAVFVLRGSNVKCVYELPDDLWPVHADVGQISQVVHNLTLNADQAMVKGGMLTIRGTNCEIGEDSMVPLKPGRYVSLSFEDQGPGISADNKANIFVPYFSTKHEGTGLGLATSYSIIKNHDGYLSVESDPAKGGSTFIFYLPASEVMDDDPAADTLEDIKSGSGRILFMDDDQTIRETIEEALALFGYRVFTVADGREALDEYRRAIGRSEPYDVVILDLTVPGGMGGSETINKLLQIDPDVKAVVSSGYSDDPIMANYQEFGFKAVVPKPYRVETLCSILNKLLR